MELPPEISRFHRKSLKLSAAGAGSKCPFWGGLAAKSAMRGSNTKKALYLQYASRRKSSSGGGGRPKNDIAPVIRSPSHWWQKASRKPPLNEILPYLRTAFH